MLKKHVRRINLMFDGDEAGRRAAQKSTQMAVKEDLEVKTFILPEGEDPDSYFKNGGTIKSIRNISGLAYLAETGVEMSPLLKKLYRLELLERGMLYMANQVPAVSIILNRRGKLDELFSVDLMPRAMEVLAKH